MDKKNYTNSSPKITFLLNEVEKVSGFKARTPKDFNHIAEQIFITTGNLLSATTLKRIWGYIDGPSSIRMSTLNILAKYAGYTNWENLNVSFDNNKNTISLEIIRSYELLENEKLEICWIPNRKIEIKYLLNNSFIVENQHNTALQKGDIFSCSLFALHEPLYLEKLEHEKKEPYNCVLGGSMGLTLIKKIGLSTSGQ